MKKMTYRILSCAVLSALPLLAHAELRCFIGSKASVSGRVTTLNVSPTRQAGQICLTLTSASGREVFDQCGAIVGTIQSLDTETGSSTLNHTVLFSTLQAFTTRNDAAQIIGVTAVDEAGAPCAFSVMEKISQIAWSSGILQTGAANITAQGTISACPDKNLNTFTLSGEACIRYHR